MPFHGFLQVTLVSAMISAALSPVVASESTDNGLPQLVVSATRFEQSSVTTPASIQIIGAKEIEQSKASNLTDLLRGRGGIAIYDFFGDGTKTTVGLRGFSESASSNTLIMVDGRRLNNADIGAPSLSGISLKNVERIEIIQGSAGVLFGDQAVGGVINIITRKPVGNTAELGFALGSYETYKSYFSVDRVLAEGWNLRIAGEAIDTENYRVHNDMDKSTLTGLLSYDYSDGRIFVELLRSYETLETPDSLSAAQILANRKQSTNTTHFTNTETLMQRIGLEHDLTDNWSFAGEFTNKEENNPFASFGTSRYQARQLTSLNPRMLGVFEMNGSEMLMTAGIDFEDTSFMTINGTTRRSNQQETTSYYVQSVVPLNSQASLTAGVRHARQENNIVDQLVYPAGRDFTEDLTVGELGLNYKLHENSRLFARVEQNYRFPKIDEQSYTSPGNVLKTQTGVSWEAGFDHAYEKGWVSANLYRLDLEDEIAFDTTATKPVGGAFNGANVNFDPTRHQGVILQGGYSLFKDVELSASYSYTDARFRSGVYSGNRISFIPEHSARVSTDWRFNERAGVMLEALYTGERYLSGDNVNNLAPEDAFTVLNLSTRYEWQKYRLGLRVNNITSEKYNDFASTFGFGGRYGYPAPERNFMLEASVEL